MHKQEISKEEVPFILKKFNRSLWLSLLVFPFVLFILFLPLYRLFFLINLLFLKNHFDQEEIFSCYALSIVALVLTNFLYGKIILGKKIRNRKVYKVQEMLLVQKKDTYTYTSDTVSNSTYFRLYLLGEHGDQKGIYISKEDFRRIKENTPIQLTYYEKVNIAVTGWYENEKLDFFRFFVVKKWKHIKMWLFYCRLP